jgi:hypothetical protein
MTRPNSISVREDEYYFEKLKQISSLLDEAISHHDRSMLHMADDILKEIIIKIESKGDE